MGNLADETRNAQDHYISHSEVLLFNSRGVKDSRYGNRLAQNEFNKPIKPNKQLGSTNYKKIQFHYEDQFTFLKKILFNVIKVELWLVGGDKPSVQILASLLMVNMPKYNPVHLFASYQHKSSLLYKL